MPDDKTKQQDPPADNPQDKKTPPPDAGDKGDAGTSFEMPDKFKGKSAEEIARSYIELEKKAGSQSSDVEDTRKQLKQWEALGQVIEGDPDLKKKVVERIDAIKNGGKAPDKTDDKHQDDTKSKAPDDTRIAMEDKIMTDFEKEYGIHLLPVEQRKEINKAIGKELAEMLDPTGTKTFGEIVSSVPLNRLPVILDKAYKLATASNEKERARAQGYIRARENHEATFGSIPSGGGSSEEVVLTEEQKKAAKRLNVSEDKYKQQLISMRKGE